MLNLIVMKIITSISLLYFAFCILYAIIHRKRRIVMLIKNVRYNQSGVVIRCLFLLLAFFFVSCSTFTYKEKDLFYGATEESISPYPPLEVTFLPLSEDVLLETWIITPAEPEVAFLFFSGDGGLSGYVPFLKDIASRFGAKVVAVQYQGYGLSTGTASIEALKKDSREVTTKVKEQYAQDVLLIVGGHSLGGYAALTTAGMPEVAGYYIISTFSSSKELAGVWQKELIPWYAKPFVKVEVDPQVFTLDNYVSIEKVKVPIVIVHGTIDTTIPFWMSQRLFDACPTSEKLLIKVEGANHNNILSKKEGYIENTIAALGTLLNRLSVVQ